MGLNEAFKKLLSNKWLLAITAIGLLLLVYGASGGGGGQSPGGGTNATPVSTTTTAATANTTNVTATATDGPLRIAIAYETFYERQLTQMIDQIAGVRDAVVMVSVDSTSAERFGQNLSTSRQTTTQSGGGNSTSTTTVQTQTSLVTVQGQNGSQVPIVVQQQLPHITGVLVVARSADPIRMESEIVGAVEDVLGIPSYEITVLPRK